MTGAKPLKSGLDLQSRGERWRALECHENRGVPVTQRPPWRNLAGRQNGHHTGLPSKPLRKVWECDGSSSRRRDDPCRSYALEGSGARKLHWTGSARVDFEDSYMAGTVSRRARHLAFRPAAETSLSEQGDRLTRWLLFEGGTLVQVGYLRLQQREDRAHKHDRRPSARSHAKSPWSQTFSRSNGFGSFAISAKFCGSVSRRQIAISKTPIQRLGSKSVETRSID
jgi:hypothetical protein